MTRIRGALLAVLGALMVVLIPASAAGPAAAGGPTSVLIVVPSSGRTASLHVGDADYPLLGEFLGPVPDGSTPAGADAEPATNGEVTVTWLIHDAVVWRMDRLTFLENGEIWIDTAVDHDGSTSIWDVASVRHRADDPAGLGALLTRLGVNPTNLVEASSAAESVVASPSVAAPAPVGTVTDSQTDSPSDSAADAEADSVKDAAPGETARTSPWDGGLGWGLGGLAVGAGVALGLNGLRRRRFERTDHREPEPEPGSAEPAVEFELR